MRRENQSSRIVIAGVLAVAVMATGLITAGAALAKGQDVTFVNQSKRHQELLVAYGADEKCDAMPTQENVSLDPGESQTVESGESKVCWCAGSGKVKVSQCQQWHATKAGRKVRLTQ